MRWDNKTLGTSRGSTRSWERIDCPKKKGGKEGLGKKEIFRESRNGEIVKDFGKIAQHHSPKGVGVRQIQGELTRVRVAEGGGGTGEGSKD